MDNLNVRDFQYFFDFALCSQYGSLGGLDRLKRLPQGVETISTPGKPHSENFFFEHFLTPPPQVATTATAAAAEELSYQQCDMVAESVIQPFLCPWQSSKVTLQPQGEPNQENFEIVFVFNRFWGPGGR